MSNIITKMKKVLSLIALLGLTIGVYLFVNSDAANLPPEVLAPSKASDTAIAVKPKALSVSNTKRDSIVKFGMQLLGTPYAEAGCSLDGFDCSGFVFYVFKKFNVNVPRSSAQYQDFGKTVPIDDVQIGDVLVFKSPTRDAIGHVGIVTKPNGMETEFAHATSGKAYQVVISNLKQEGYRDRYIKAVDVLGLDE